MLPKPEAYGQEVDPLERPDDELFVKEALPGDVLAHGADRPHRRDARRPPVEGHRAHRAGHPRRRRGVLDAGAEGSAGNRAYTGEIANAGGRAPIRARRSARVSSQLVAAKPCTSATCGANSGGCAPQAVEISVLSSLSIPLPIQDLIGAFNIYSGSPNSFDDDDVRAGEAFAAYAAIAVAMPTRSPVRQNRGAPPDSHMSRATIKQAKGILGHWRHHPRRGVRDARAGVITREPLPERPRRRGRRQGPAPAPQRRPAAGRNKARRDRTLRRPSAEDRPKKAARNVNPGAAPLRRAADGTGPTSGAMCCGAVR